MKNKLRIFAPPHRIHSLIFQCQKAAILSLLLWFPGLIFAQFIKEFQPGQIQWPAGGYARFQALQSSDLCSSVKMCLFRMFERRNRMGYSPFNYRELIQP
jgi:hypothetical protein